MSTLKLTTLSNFAGTKSVPADTVIDGSAKAWVNFNGSGTVAIRGAFNVSSITDAGVGQYVANFTTPMPTVNFATVTSAWTPAVTDGIFGVAGRTVNNVTLNAANSSGSAVDPVEANAAVFI